MLNWVCITAPNSCSVPSSSWRSPNLPSWRNHSVFLTPTERYRIYKSFVMKFMIFHGYEYKLTNFSWWLLKVSGFDADADDTAWSINIKKGLATSLQVDHSTGDEFGKDENAYMRTVEVFTQRPFMIFIQLNIVRLHLGNRYWYLQHLLLLWSCSQRPLCFD